NGRSSSLRTLFPHGRIGREPAIHSPSAGVMDSGLAPKRQVRAWELRRSGADAHQRNAVELGLFGGAFRLAFAHLVAFVEQLDLLELVEGLGQRKLRVFELDAQFVGRALEVLTPRDRRLGIGRIGEMPRIVDAGAVLLDLDFALQVAGHAIEFGDHGFDLRDLAALLVDLKFLQADQRFTRLHRLLLPEAIEPWSGTLPLGPWP